MQRSVFLSNADDRIYKSDDVDGEFAYLMKYGNYPLFIDYAAIDALRSDATIQELWRKNSGVEIYFKSDLVQAFAHPSKGQALKNKASKTYLYDGKASKLEETVFDDKGLATIVAAVTTGGAKMYQQGGGDRLPGATGVVMSFKMSREEVCRVLGVDPANYSKVMFLSRANWDQYALELKGATEGGRNVFNYENPDAQAYFFYVSAVEVSRNLNARIQIENQRISDDQLANVGVGSTDEQGLKSKFSKLGTPTADTGWVPGTKINKKDRGDGQAAAMNNWNALGAAAYANKFLGANYPLNQNWEWLHIRGAQVGGETESTNLIPGLYVTNSFMIPYENMVLQWAMADPQHFFTRWTVDPAGTLFARYITINIAAEGHQTLGTLGSRLLVRFDALHGKVVDRLANEMTKRMLDRTVRA